MNLQPTLTGPTLELVPVRESDFERLYAVAADPLVWALHPARNRCERPVFEAFFAEALASKGAFLVIERSSGRVAGSSRYYGYDPVKREVCIGFTFLGRDWWGGAANREMKKLMLDHAFESVDAVDFHVGRDNLRSRRAMEKIGGKLFADFDTRTKATTNVTYRITRESWLAAQSRT